jgi:dipeptidase E
MSTTSSTRPRQGLQRRSITFKKQAPPTTLRGVFAGCGTILNHPSMAPHVLSLTGKGSTPHNVTLVYLGTPSYDIPAKCVAQTSHYVELGCTVTPLNVVLESPTTDYMQRIIDSADIILVSGGNTSFAMRRWKHLGLDGIIKDACLGPRKVVMAGGSAGAIW